MKKIVILIWLFMFIGIQARSIRTYSHVKEFYGDIAAETVKLGIKYNVPPAAILAIAGLESGYGTGYIARITGNILSLGANKGELRLPPLYLPNVKTSGKILYNKDKIAEYDEDELDWKQRPASLKKDYRPAKFRGTTENLTYFDKHHKQKVKAELENIKDFMNVWLNENYKFEVFSNARKYLDAMVLEYGNPILFRPELNNRFIEKIGGKPGSFNHRESWVKKVKWIMKNAKLVELTARMYYFNENFEDAWNKL